MQIHNYYSKFYLTLLAIIAVVCFFMYHNYIFAQDSKYSITTIFDCYGFTQQKQQQAIQNLFQRSSIISVNTTLKEAFSDQDTPEKCMLDIIRIIKKTHERFVVRSGTQERWEVHSLDWAMHNQDKILSDLQILGFVDAVKLSHKTSDAFCVLGTTGPKMADRIAYLISIIESGFSANSIILLAGERYVTKGIDGTEEELTKIAKEFNLDKWSDLTETHLMEHIFRTSSLYDKNFELYVINTPRGNLPRPTTQTTTFELIKWLKDHEEIKNIVFISNQPHVSYQKSIIDIIF